jgi:hypothetical protein
MVPALSHHAGAMRANQYRYIEIFSVTKWGDGKSERILSEEFSGANAGAPHFVKKFRWSDI